MAVPDEIPHGSKEFLTVVLDSTDDLTTSSVEIGVTVDPVGQPSSYMAAAWVPLPAKNTARTASIWDTTNVALGFYAIWAKVTDSPEIIPRRYGTVRVV